jgi:beta-lactamase regulating signal transducer with metallopeptidase domain
VTGVVGWISLALVLGTLLAGLTWLLTRFTLPRLTPAAHAALWSIVLLKFLIPIGPGQPMSLANAWEAVRDRLPMQLPTVAVAEIEPQETPLLATESESASRASTSSTLALPTAALTALAVLYLGGVLLVVVRRGRRYLDFASQCRALPEADASTRRLVQRVCRRLGVRRVPSIRISDEMPAPFIIGIFRPTLVLSRLHLGRPNELETVVVHEVTHLRRGDLTVRCLQWIAGALFFFWPVVAWVNRRIDAAREQACDQWALRHGKLAATDYARCLLRAARGLSARRIAYRPACMAGRMSTIERRIDMILESSAKPALRPRWRVVAVVLLLVVWGGFALTGPTAAGDKGKIEISDESNKAHAENIVKRISAYPSADVNSNGEIEFSERNAFLVTLFLQSPAAAIEVFPYSAPFGGRELELLEIYDLVRGLSYRMEMGKPIKKRYGVAKEEGAGAEVLETIKIQAGDAERRAVAVVLDAQDALLDLLTVEPEADKVATIHAKIDATRGTEKVEVLRKKAQEIELKIEQLEADGKTEKAEDLRQHLKDIEGKIKEIHKKLHK